MDPSHLDADAIAVLERTYKRNLVLLEQQMAEAGGESKADIALINHRDKTLAILADLEHRQAQFATPHQSTAFVHLTDSPRDLVISLVQAHLSDIHKPEFTAWESRGTAPSYTIHYRKSDDAAVKQKVVISDLEVLTHAGYVIRRATGRGSHTYILSRKALDEYDQWCRSTKGDLPAGATIPNSKDVL